MALFLGVTRRVDDGLDDGFVEPRNFVEEQRPTVCICLEEACVKGQKTIDFAPIDFVPIDVQSEAPKASDNPHKKHKSQHSGRLHRLSFKPFTHKHI